MQRVRFFLLLSFLLALLWGPRQQQVQAQAGPAAEALQLVNQLRAEHGLPAYQYNATLAAAAQRHANWMAANTIFSSHTGEAGTSPQDRANQAGYNGYVAENIVGGTGMTPAQGLIWWRNSALHYSMMVSNRYVEAGVAFATNGRENMYVMVMGRPSTTQVRPADADLQPDPLFITPIALAQPREDGSIVHKVLDGQALWQIAAHYEVTVDHLMWINSFNQDTMLHPGDEVWVRLAEGQPPPPTPTPPLHHSVRKGENSWIIAARYKIDLDTFFYLNQLTEDSVLQPGEQVRIRLAPGEPPPPTPTPKLAHIVREGETLWTVAALNGLTMEDLLAYNVGVTDESILHPGDQLYIRQPVTATPPATPTAPATPTPDAARMVALAAATIAFPSSTPTKTPVMIVASVPTPTPDMVPAETEDSASNMLSIVFGGAVLLGAGLLFWRGRS